MTEGGIAEDPREKRRIVVIGPVLPFRGGIAQHTTMLARALREKHDCNILSFTRLYPRALFPGASDRDPDYQGHQEPCTDYPIDTLNPLTWPRVLRHARSYQPDFALIPWWTFFLGPLWWYLAHGLRKSGIDVVFFCHNVLDHEEAAWKRLLTQWVLLQGSRFVVHTRVEEVRLKRLIPSARISVHPHPIYEQFPEPKRALPRRAGLELLFYGFVRPYKGLDLLIDAMGLLRDEDVFLTVAGEFWAGEQEAIARIKELDVDDKIELRPHYHSDEDTAEMFQRADLVILPYRAATGTGVVPIAYHYGKPVVVTNVGGLPDVVANGRTGWIVRAGDAVALANQIRGIDRLACEGMRPEIEEFKRAFSWPKLARAVCGTADGSGH